MKEIKKETMRNYFAHHLYKKMAEDKDIYLITADLGFGMFDDIRSDFPNRFINTGAAEHLALGMAVGLALSGKRPFVYSITPFLLARPYEVIRNYVNKECLPIVLVGSGRDDDYKHDGFSHYAYDAKYILDNFDNIAEFWPDGNKGIGRIIDEVCELEVPSFISLRRD